MDKKSPSIASLVLIPAIVTLIVTVVRLIGEMNGWDAMWFGTPENSNGALLGISWLIFVFGFWFGLRLQRSGAGVANPNKTLIKIVVAVAVTAACVAICTGLDLISMPTPEEPGEMRGIAYFMGSLGLGALLAFVAWPRVALALLVYGLLARIPVAVITWLAVNQEWNTHYAKLAKQFTVPADADLLTLLIMPQVTFWPMLTILGGTASAALAARVFSKPKKG